jgi:Xaa-Pro aminopeptidase
MTKSSVFKLSAEFHRDRLDKLYDYCTDGLILLRGEWDWFRKRELRSFDPAYRDTDFKQEKNLYYLTGLEIPNCFVLVDPRRRQFHVYADWQNSRELENARALGVDKVNAPGSFLRDVRIYGEQYGNLYVLYAPLLEDGPMFTKNAVMTGVFPPGMGEPLTEEMQFARRLSELFPSHRIKSICPVLNELRKIKQPEEIRLLRLANKASVQGILEALKAIKPGLYNHDISAVIEYAFRREGAVGPTFSHNLMSGPHQFTKLGPLWADYYHLDRELMDGEGIFIDIGAEVGYYLCDIGRTAPVAGRFTPEQRKLYEIYLPCYWSALKSIRPSATQRDLVRNCVNAMEQQLPNLTEDWLRKAGEDFITTTRNRPTLGHYIDIDVIGKGPSPDEALMPGMVFAIEPLLFCPEKEFAVFVEDNVLVTPDGYEVLSSGLPYTVEEIEAVMAQPGIIEKL